MKFIGNVLPPTGHKPEGDHTFDFTQEEARNMDLTGIPIRIEHADSLPVGKVTKQWTTKNGEKWIIAEIENKDLASNYANHAIQPDSRGHTLYKGLSLQHVHQQWTDGTTFKRPVEVSICTQPRRPDCYIRAVSKTKKNEYIAHKASVKMAEEIQETPQTETQPDEEAARQVANSQEELMKMFLEQDEKNNELEAQMKKIQEEKDALQKKWDEREANERLQVASKAEALSKALVESWQNTLPAGELTDENKKAIFALAQNFPQESVQMMEIAHKASLKHAGTQHALEESQAMSKKKVLEQQVVSTILKKRRVMDSPVETVQVASKKAYNPFETNQNKAEVKKTFGEKNAMLFGALKGMSQGNARSVMDSIAKYRKGI